jgi:hypothetical protein
MGAPGGILHTIYRDERFAVGIGMPRHRINNELYERRGMEIVCKSTDNQNSIVFHRPCWCTNPNQDNWLSRSSPFLANVQRQLTLVALFNILEADPFTGGTRPARL